MYSDEPKKAAIKQQQQDISNFLGDRHSDQNVKLGAAITRLWIA